VVGVTVVVVVGVTIVVVVGVTVVVVVGGAVVVVEVDRAPAVVLVSAVVPMQAVTNKPTRRALRRMGET
jgi:hypothetical protein